MVSRCTKNNTNFHFKLIKYSPIFEDQIFQQKQPDFPAPRKRAPLSQSFTMETMLSFADSSSSSQDEADDEEEESEEEEEEDEKEKEDWVKPTDDGEELRNEKNDRSLSLVRTEFSSQPDLPTFIQVSMCALRTAQLVVK